MTESEWLVCTHANAMLCFLDERRQGSPRKFRLFACACARRLGPLLRDERSRRAIDVAEQYADRQVSKQDLSDAEQAARAAAEAMEKASAPEPVVWAARAAAALTFRITGPLIARNLEPACGLAAAIDTAYQAAQASPAGPQRKAAERAHADLLREIIGNPFQPVPQGSRSLLRNRRCVARIARRLYDERCFEDLPLLADALEDAGCPEAGLLAHFREPGSHVRGCWALDWVLDKS